MTTPSTTQAGRREWIGLAVLVLPVIVVSMKLPLVALDPPEHTARRKALVPEFTAKKVQALRPRIQEIVDAHVDAMLERGGPLDLVEALALPVPSLLFC